jgi:hypothetical protein
MLSQLGAFLARQNASQIQIADEGEFLSVSWQPAGSTRRQGCFRESELANVPPLPTNNPRATNSPPALLGLLGRRLDSTGMDVARIEQKADGFTVSASTWGRYSDQRYSYADLRGEEDVPPPPASVKPKARSSGRGRTRSLETARSKSIETAASRTLPLSAVERSQNPPVPDPPTETVPAQVVQPQGVPAASNDSPLRRRLQLA